MVKCLIARGAWHHLGSARQADEGSRWTGDPSRTGQEQVLYVGTNGFGAALCMRMRRCNHRRKRRARCRKSAVPPGDRAEGQGAHHDDDSPCHRAPAVDGAPRGRSPHRSAGELHDSARTRHHPHHHRGGPAALHAASPAALCRVDRRRARSRRRRLGRWRLRLRRRLLLGRLLRRLVERQRLLHRVDFDLGRLHLDLDVERRVDLELDEQLVLDLVGFILVDLLIDVELDLVVERRSQGAGAADDAAVRRGRGRPRPPRAAGAQDRLI